MSPTTNRRAAPTPITQADRERMAAAVAAGEERRARQRRTERVARLAVCAIAVAAAVGLFYGLTGGAA